MEGFVEAKSQLGMQGCVEQVHELDSIILVRVIDGVVDEMGREECHALILLDTPSYEKDPSMCINEPLKALPKERGRI